MADIMVDSLQDPFKSTLITSLHFFNLSNIVCMLDCIYLQLACHGYHLVVWWIIFVAVGKH